MKKEIREVTNGIVRVTTVDERWYARTINDPTTGLPVWHYVPSVTWIAEHYPKGIGFYKWLANTGWDEAQALKEAAGDKGSKVHTAIARLIAGETVKMDEPLPNPSIGQLEPMTLEEYQAILSFAKWFEATKPTTMSHDMTVWNDAEDYAGTVDYCCSINGVPYLIDFKTSKAIYPSHRMQVSAYRHAMTDPMRLAILQLGYERNALGYKFTDVEDCYPLFLAAKQIWAEETKGQQPHQRDYPLQIVLKTVVPAEVTTTTAVGATSAGDANGTNGGRRTETDVRTSHRGRVVGGAHRGSAVRPAAKV